MDPAPAVFATDDDGEHGADEDGWGLDGPVEAAVPGAEEAAVGREQEVGRIGGVHVERDGPAHDAARVGRKPRGTVVAGTEWPP